MGSVAAAGVGQHALHGDAVGGEPVLGPGPERGGGLSGLVLVDLAVGQPGVVVDGGVDVGVAVQRLAATVGPAGGPVGVAVVLALAAAELAPATAGRDHTELLDVDVDQPARIGVLVTDRGPGGSVQPGQTLQTASGQYPVHGGGRDPDQGGDLDRPEPLLGAVVHDLAD